MTEIDRRAFLQSTGMLGADMFAGKFRGYVPDLSQGPPGDTFPAPSYEPFEWNPPGQVFSFEFLSKRLLFRTLLAEGISAPLDIPSPTDVSGVETSIHCTGENPDDHHGPKLTGGSPGARLVDLGRARDRDAHREDADSLPLRSCDWIEGRVVLRIVRGCAGRPQKYPRYECWKGECKHRVFELGYALQPGVAAEV
jgi:hypothetical protein